MESNSYRFDLFANTAGESRTYDMMFWAANPDFRLRGNKAMSFIAPHGSDVDGNTDFNTCTFRIPNSAHTARIVATNGVVTSLGVFTNCVGTLVKGGAGSISIGLPYDARVNSTGAIVVDEGTLEIRGSESGDNYVPSLIVKSGATLRIPDGLACGTFNAEAGATVEGGVLVCGSVDESVFSRVVLGKGAACRSLVPSGAKFDVEVVSGSVRSRNVDKVCTVSGDALFRVTGSGTFNVLLLGGGGGGGYKAGGGDGGSGVAMIRFRRKEKGFVLSF